MRRCSDDPRPRHARTARLVLPRVLPKPSQTMPEVGGDLEPASSARRAEGFGQPGRTLAAFAGSLALLASVEAQNPPPFSATIEETAGATSVAHFCDVVLTVNAGGFTNTAYRFFVTGPAQIVGGHARSVPYSQGGAAEASSGIDVDGTMKVRVRFPGNTVASTPFKILLASYLYFPPGTDPSTGQPTPGGYVENYRTYGPQTLRSLSIDIASVDQRKTYAPPNKDGSYPAVDANADLRNVAFAGWAYKGGLFVGNAAGQSGDQSGVARIQCQTSDPNAPANGVYALSLLHIGPPGFFKGATTPFDGGFPIQAYVPSGNPGPLVPLGSLTWANALDPAACTALGDAIDLAGAANKEYVNFQFGAGSLPSRVLVASPAGTTAQWRYFVGPTYAPTSGTPPAPIYPYSECRPHLWALDLASTSTDWGFGAISLSQAWWGAWGS